MSRVWFVEQHRLRPLLISILHRLARSAASTLFTCLPLFLDEYIKMTAPNFQEKSLLLSLERCSKLFQHLPCLYSSAIPFTYGNEEKKPIQCKHQVASFPTHMCWKVIYMLLPTQKCLVLLFSPCNGKEKRILL